MTWSIVKGKNARFVLTINSVKIRTSRREEKGREGVGTSRWDEGVLKFTWVKILFHASYIYICEGGWSICGSVVAIPPISIHEGLDPRPSREALSHLLGTIVNVGQFPSYESLQFYFILYNFNHNLTILEISHLLLPYFCLDGSHVFFFLSCKIDAIYSDYWSGRAKVK